MMTTPPAPPDRPLPRPWQVTIIKHGTTETSRSDSFLNYQFYGEPDGPQRVDYYLWILRRGEETIIVDTGFSAQEGAARDRTILIDPIEAVQKLGVDPSAGHPVVITHAHYDHIGNIAAFANSPIYIASAEWEFWTGELADRTLIAHFGDSAALAALHQAHREGRLHTFGDGETIAPGVDVWVQGGHTPGQACIEVETSEGHVVLASDAMHFFEELDRDMLFVAMTDVPHSYLALERLRDHPRERLISGHDPGELDRHQPVAGPLAGLAATVGEP